MTRPSSAAPAAPLLTGSGAPVTLVVHGLTGSVAQTRPFASGVRGTRAFPVLRGHGGRTVPADGPGDYGDLAREVSEAFLATGATRALGVSLGAGAVVRALVDDLPGAAAVDRLVLCLPPALVGDDDGPEGTPARDEVVLARFDAMAEALDTRDVPRLAALLREHQPIAVRDLPVVAAWARHRAAELVAELVEQDGDAGLAAVLRVLPRRVAVPDPAALARLDLPVLVVAQEGDDVHPVADARDWAGAFKDASLEVLAAGAIPWTGRERLREIIASFLNVTE